MPREGLLGSLKAGVAVLFQVPMNSMQRGVITYELVLA